MKKIIRPTKIVLIVLAIVCVSISGFAFENIKDEVNQSFTVGSGGTLTVDTARGSIEVEAGDGNKVAVQILREVKTSNQKTADDVLKRYPIEFDQRGDNVYVTVEYKEKGLTKLLDKIRNKLRLKFIISVPKQYNVDLKTSGGSISVLDLAGQVDCKTSGGSLKFDHISGPIQGKTSGGGISIGEVTGDVKVRTSGGSISIDRALGEVNAHTSGGSITVNEVMGTINADTSGGSIKAHISQQPQADCSLTTSGGSIRVYMAENIGVDLEAKTSGGSVNTEFPVTVSGKIKKNYLKAKLNGGGPQLYLKTSGGSIYIKKK